MCQKQMLRLLLRTYDVGVDMYCVVQKNKSAAADRPKASKTATHLDRRAAGRSTREHKPAQANQSSHSHIVLHLHRHRFTIQYHGLASEAGSNNTERMVCCSRLSLHYHMFATPPCHGILPAGITPINGAST